MYLRPVSASPYVLFAIENQDRHYLRISFKLLTSFLYPAVASVPFGPAIFSAASLFTFCNCAQAHI